MDCVVSARWLAEASEHRSGDERGIGTLRGVRAGRRGPATPVLPQLTAVGVVWGAARRAADDTSTTTSTHPTRRGKVTVTKTLARGGLRGALS